MDSFSFMLEMGRLYFLWVRFGFGYFLPNNRGYGSVIGYFRLFSRSSVRFDYARITSVSIRFSVILQKILITRTGEKLKRAQVIENN